MANSACSVKTPTISSAFISKEGNEILSSMKAPRYVDYINTLFGNVFKREYLDNDSFITLSDFTDDNNKLTVNGNLNNLYTKVKEELVRQINSDFVNTLPVDTINGLTAILENWKLFVDFHSKYNSYIAIRPEDLEEQEKEATYYDKAGNEHNEFQLLTNEVRTIFKFLPKTQLVKDSSGNIIGVPVVNPIDGLPVRSDFENIFKLTLDALKGIKDEDKFIQKLSSEEMLYRIPELFFLFEVLPVNKGVGTSLLTNKQRMLFHQFFQIMSRDYIPVHASTVTKEKGKLPNHIRYQSAKSNINKIEKQFISNFISNQDTNEYVIIDNNVDEQKAENSTFGRKRLIALPAKLPLIDLSTDEINSLSVRKIKSEYKPYFDFYKLIGIEFSDFSLLSDKRSLIKVLNHALTIHDNLSERLNNKVKIYSPIDDVREIFRYTDKNNKVKTVNSLRSVLKDVFKFEGTISKISPTLVTKAANGENQSDITYSNAISIASQQINEATSLEDLYTKPYFIKLKYNPLHKGSYVANKIIGNPNIGYQIENYSGHTTIEDEDQYSSDTKSLSDVEKFESDFNNLLGWGTINTPQLESKSGYFAVKYIDKTTDRAILPFPESLFTEDFITNSEFTAQILNYLHGEIDRIKSYPSVKSYAPKAYSEFSIFKDFVSEENKKDLLKSKNTAAYKKAEGEVLSNINAYFNRELDNIKGFIAKNNITNFISSRVLQEFKINEQLYKDNQEAYTNSLLRTFIANAFVHNVEFGIYISGDPLFYKDYHKRLGGLSSTGTQPIATENMRDYFKSDPEKIFWDNFSLRGILNQFASDKKKAERRNNFDTYLSAVLQEDNVRENTEYQKAETIDNYIYSVMLNTGKGITREQAMSALKINKIETKGIDVGDGQGYLNLDAARELSIKQGTYRPQQDVSYKYEALIFKQILLEERGESLNEDDTKLIQKLERQILRNPDKYALPTLKQTYYGTLSNENVKIDAKIFDKFSLAILLPSTARNHPKLKALLLAMANRQIHYVKYESGTKGFIRSVFSSVEDLANEKSELDELQSNLLKLQITPARTEKTSTKIPTQKIKLLFTNLFDEGNASESVKNLRNKFLSDLENIKNYNRKNVLNKLGFQTDQNGKITSWNKEKIIDSLISQINLQKLPTPLMEALETDENGDFINTIESSNIYQQLLNYVTGKLDSTLREFKVNGGDFVLISESMFANPLRYFRLNKDKSAILPCECRITLTKEYAKLLNLPDKENGGIIGSIERLNELLKREAFRKKYEKELTIVFSRPPVQGPNSMGVAIITEFFYPTAGNILQLPKEFMHQAGIDFDYDKEKVLVPSLMEDGTYLNQENVQDRIKELKSSDFFKSLVSEKRDAEKFYNYLDLELEDYDTQEDFEKAKKELLDNDESILKFMLTIYPQSKQEIEDNLQEIKKEISNYLYIKNREKGILSNSLFETMRKSLQQPEIYSELILPNTDETVKPLAIANGKDINNLNTLPQGIDVYSYMKNLEVFKLFNDAKALLGPFALHNVFMELIKPLDIKVNLDYSPDKDGSPTRKVNLLLVPNAPRIINISSRNDINGNNKQHITSEFINATVDSAKDPYFANFMLSFDNINTFTFLMSLGYPIDLIVDFTSSAIIRKYLDFKNKGLLRDEAVKEAINIISPIRLKKNITLDEVFEVDESSLDKDNSELISKLKEFKSDESLENKDNYVYLRALLANFVAMEEHAKQFSNFRALFRNDTNKTSSIYEIASKQALRNAVVRNGMFSLEDVQKVENQSTMTAFRNDDLIGEVLKTVFPIMSNPIVSQGLGDLFNESKAGLKEVDKRILSQVITNDYITNILYSFGKYKDQNFFLYGKDLLSKTKNPDGSLNTTLLERIYRFRQNKAYPELVKVFPVLEKILGEVSTKPIKGNPIYQGKYGFNIFLNIDPNIPILEREAFMNQFKQIIDGDFTIDNAMVKSALVNLIKDFFIAGIIQSGFNKTGVSFIEYAPVKFVQSLLNPALAQYNYTQANDPVFMTNYVKYFKNNLFKYNNSRYFFIPREERSRIVKSSHLGKYLYSPIKLEDRPSLLSSSTNPTDFTNNSGGALGSDTRWDEIGREFGVTNHIHYWMSNKTPIGNQEITEEDKVEGQQKVTIAARQMGRISETHQVRDERLIRNWSQVKYSEAIFAVGKVLAPGEAMNHGKKALITQVAGGTGYAVQMAINEGKPVYVFDQERKLWYRNLNNKWEVTDVPILPTKFAGIGTREINQFGEQAIRDVYTKTFSQRAGEDIQRPYPGVENIPDSGLTVEEANSFIDLLQPQIVRQAYVENKAKTANRMFSFGLRWAKNIPNETEKSKQRADNLGPRPDRVKIKSKNDYTYGYYTTDQNNNPLPPISELQSIMNFIQSKLGIDMSNYDSVLANIYEEGSFIHQHRDITESVTAEKYPVIVINLGAEGGLLYDSRLSNQDISSTDAYSKFKADSTLPIKNGGIYAFGVDGVNRFTFSHRVEEKTNNTPTKPITVPIWDENGNKIGEKTLTNYRITLTFRRAQDLSKEMTSSPKKLNEKASTVATVDKSLSWGTIKNMPIYSEKGVNVMRKQGTNEHFGNPFTFQKSGVKGLIIMPDIPSAVQAYKDWLLTNKYPDVNPEQKAWILSQISGGKLAGQTLLYMKDKGEYYSHADALADIINGIDAKPESKPINIYSTDKNGYENLSNLLNGPVIYNGFSYKTVEHLYQWRKADFAKDKQAADKIYKAKNGWEAQKLGKTIKGLDTVEWDKISSEILEESMRLAFDQNQSAKDLLASTGDFQLTHKAAFNLGKWETEFPRILMAIRDEGKVESEENITQEEVQLPNTEETEASAEEIDNTDQLQSSIPTINRTFTYNNKTIDTEFELGEQQQEALKALIDFVNSREDFITLQGAAGTGKTTIIGYLQKFMGNKATFAYMAPTHAATAELAFATVKTGSNILPSTLQSALTINSRTKRYVFTQKIQKRLGHNPVIVLDESSMIDQSDIDKLQQAIEDNGGKVIFMGDEKQISKVTTDNGKSKNVSPAFSKFNQVMLTKIYRQSDNRLLDLLTMMRQQTDFKLFKVENSDVVKFVNKKDYAAELIKDLEKDPENTVVITYTNASVKAMNNYIRSVFGRTGDTIPGDIVVGYLGYASKQIEKRDIANSISYLITDIQESGSTRIITAESSKLQRLIDSGIDGISKRATTTYYQLDTDDSLTFKNLGKLDFEKNNQEVSAVFRKAHQANVAYANQEINYQTYLSIIAGISEDLRQYSVGNDYIFNPTTDRMERFDAVKHKNIKQNGQGSLLFNKDIDYGHAITIHKSQGSTIDNVYFDSTSLAPARNTPIVNEQGVQITTEKMSLAYVAMSRSKKKLVVYEGDNLFEFLENPNKETPPNLDDIGFKKTCN